MKFFRIPEFVLRVEFSLSFLQIVKYLPKLISILLLSIINILVSDVISRFYQFVEGCEFEEIHGCLVRVFKFYNNINVNSVQIMGLEEHPIENVKIINCKFNNIKKDNVLESVQGLVLENVMINGK